MTHELSYTYLAAFAGAAALSLVLTPVARRIAMRLGIVDRPDRHLKKHRKVTPYLGGAAICVACSLPILGAKLAVFGAPHGVVGIMLGAGMVFLLGLVDDFTPLKPKTKLVFQFMAACIPVYFGVHIKFIENPFGAIPLTLLWIVGVTNAFNLLDIMDGLAGGVAFIAALCFWVISAQNGRFNDALIAAALAGGVLGFLKYNRPPARIFMGDAGSMFVGFTLASIAIGLGYSKGTNLGVTAPLLVLGIPVFETLFVMTVRWQQGKPMLQGSPDHVPLRLRRMGYSVWSVLSILWGASTILGILAFAVSHVNWERALLICVGVAFVGMLAAIRLASVRMHA